MLLPDNDNGEVLHPEVRRNMPAALRLLRDGPPCRPPWLPVTEREARDLAMTLAAIAFGTRARGDR